MKSEVQKAPAHLGEVTDVLICPDHPNNWIELHYVNGEKPDTTQFCNCCTDDCSSFCQNCDNN